MSEVDFNSRIRRHSGILLARQSSRHSETVGHFISPAEFLGVGGFLKILRLQRERIHFSRIQSFRGRHHNFIRRFLFECEFHRRFHHQHLFHFVHIKLSLTAQHKAGVTGHSRVILRFRSQSIIVFRLCHVHQGRSKEARAR